MPHDGDSYLAKERVRAHMWELLDQAMVNMDGPGGIPNFMGAEHAAERLTRLPEWQDARVIKVNPDDAQMPVRRRALQEGKHVYVAVPRLELEYPFVQLDPEQPGERMRTGIAMRLSEMRPVDLVVSGSLAVNRNGARVGKGAGYTDIELGLLMDAGLIDGNTPVASTVHDLQVMDEELPRCSFDFELSIIVTPTTVIRVENPSPSPGIVWSEIDPKQVAAIPVLGQLRFKRG